MVCQIKNSRSLFLVCIALACANLVGCAKTAKQAETVTVVVQQSMNELERDPVPGTVNDVWVEPMIDTVRVPGQLDPKGTYYRPSHYSVVQIRPGRFQQVQYPADEKVNSR